MKFYGTPYRGIPGAKEGGKLIGTFSPKGIFETSDEEYIQRLKAAGFKSECQEETTSTATETPATEPTNTAKKYKCQKCEAEFDKPLELAQHSRKFHKKGK